MTRNHIILPLLSLTLLTACIDEHESGDNETPRSGEIGRMFLANGNLLIFMDDDPSDAVAISLLEIAATPEPGGAIEEMNAAGATPAELWLSMSDKEIPRALVEAHADEREDVPRAFAMPERLRETTEEVDFRSFAYGGAWGGSNGYCGSSFAGDWDSWAGTPDDDDYGPVGFGNVVELAMGNGTHAWVGVCNDTEIDPVDPDFTQSQMKLFRDINPSGTPVWSQLLCSSAPTASWCMDIQPQYGKGMHWWSGTAYTYKAQAAWASGIAHYAYLRVRVE